AAIHAPGCQQPGNRSHQRPWKQSQWPKFLRIDEPWRNRVFCETFMVLCRVPAATFREALPSPPSIAPLAIPGRPAPATAPGRAPAPVPGLVAPAPAPMAGLAGPVLGRPSPIDPRFPPPPSTDPLPVPGAGCVDGYAPLMAPPSGPPMLTPHVGWFDGRF